MSEIFVISDTHFGHKNILNFEFEGEKLRDFDSLDEMHETIINRWNNVVTKKDIVYHLGDVASPKNGLNLLHMLNGRKRLVRGNHDNFKINLYREYFSEIHGVRQINGLWLTHVPMHPHSVLQPRVKANIHGHLHADKIAHPRWINVCVECTDYTPISFTNILENLHE